MMIVFYMISVFLMIAAIVLLLGLTPERITDDILHIISPKQSLRDKVRIAQGKKKSRKVSTEIKKMQAALTAAGKSVQFTVVCTISLILLVCGGLIGAVMDNLLLVPILLYAKRTIAYYNRHIENELETALSIITTSYVRSQDFVTAVSENITYIKPPVRDVFKSFLGEANAISSNLKTAIQNLKYRIDNEIFHEWCETLIACQDDRTLKDTLLPVVNRLTDIRIINSELKTMLYEPRKEYYSMVALVIGNIPLLYMLNGDWFSALMNTLPGKIVLAGTGLAVIITSLRMFRYTSPVKYI